MNLSRMVAIAGFLTALAALGALELASRREGSRIPSLGDVCACVLRYQVGPIPVGRIGVFGFWWWLGWHFFAR